MPTCNNLKINSPRCLSITESSEGWVQMHMLGSNTNRPNKISNSNTLPFFIQIQFNYIAILKINCIQISFKYVFPL